MPNPIIIQFAFWLYNISVACGWQPIMQYPQPIAQYRVNCVLSMQAPGAKTKLWLASGVVQGPVSVGGKDYDIIQETY